MQGHSDTALPDDAAEQPIPQRAAAAVAVAPVLALLALTLVTGDLIGPTLGLAGVLASVAWLVLEMHLLQRLLASDEEAAYLRVLSSEGGGV